jgi:glycosyltransferase involved in cell wall biosynthesis
MRRISILGSFSGRNKGDLAILRSELTELKRYAREELTVYIFTKDVTRITKYFGNMIIDTIDKIELKYRLVIVGYGAQKEQFKQMTYQLGLKNKVIFTGLSKNPAGLICAFDMAVIPSRREAFGITAVEFMRMKIPVIASKIGGLVELIQNNNTGLLLDKLNSDNITQAVIKLEQDSCLRENLKKMPRFFPGNSMGMNN